MDYDYDDCRPPQYLYKYHSYRGLQETLRNHARLWSHPGRFNDPFDSQFKRRWAESLDEFLKGRGDIPKALRKSTAFQKLMTPFYEQELLSKTFMWELYFQHKLNNTVIFCLTENHTNLLMWAHYAGNHTGGALQYAQTPELSDCQISSAKQVRYKVDIPVFHFEEFLGSCDNAEKKRAMADAFWDAYTLTKSAEWRYEKEWRLLQELEELAPVVLVDFEPKELSAVYLGCRMPPKNHTEIMALIQAEYPHAAVYQAQTHNAKFALEFERIF